MKLDILPIGQYEENVYMMKYFDVRIEKLEDRHE